MCARVSVCVCVCTHRHQHVALLLFKLCRRLLLPLRLILIKAIAIESSRESHRLDKRAKHTDTRTHRHAQFLNDLETVTGFFRPTSTYVSPSVCVCVCIRTNCDYLRPLWLSFVFIFIFVSNFALAWLNYTLITTYVNVCIYIWVCDREITELLA